AHARTAFAIASDAYEREADRAAELVTRTGSVERADVSLTRVPARSVQRACAQCEKEDDDGEAMLAGSDRGPLDTATTPEDEQAAEEPAPAPAPMRADQGATSPGEETSAAPSAAQAEAAGLLVADDAAEVTPNQMRKSEFLAELRRAVRETADQALAGT